MKRRAFIAGLGGAAAWPVLARAQQPAIPVIGFLSSRSAQDSTALVAAFRRGLAEAGFIEGKNVEIIFKWAEGHYDKLPSLADDLVNRQVAVIATGGGPPSGEAAKHATSTIPVIFSGVSEPVGFGLVANLNRPGGNVSGVSIFTSELNAKRLELLHQMVPQAIRIALLINPSGPSAAQQARDVEQAAHDFALNLTIFQASNEGQLRGALANISEPKADALIVLSDPFMEGHQKEIIESAEHAAIPAMFPWREYVEAGGLMSYGTKLADSYRQAGVYVGRVLNGERPSDLPVALPTKFEFLINMATAKKLRLRVSPVLLATADEVIE